jgi:hypothetical protein
MRPLTEQETQTLFAKLASYTGGSLKNLIAPLDNSPNADRYVFRYHRDRVYYVLLSIANLATSIARDKLLSLGVCLGTELLTPVHVWFLSLTALHIPRKIHKVDQGLPSSHNRASNPRRACPLQGLGQEQWRDALLLRRQHRQGPRRPLVRRLPRAPGRRCLQHERHPAGLWSNRAKHGRGAPVGSDGGCMLPASRLRRISARRGHAVCGMKMVWAKFLLLRDCRGEEGNGCI